MSEACLVTGGRGKLGGALARELARRGRQACLLDLPELDVTREDDVLGRWRELRPEVVFHAAAMTGVDACEGDPAAAERVNGNAPGIVARACAEVNARLVLISTDYVFGGNGARGPFREEDPTAPTGVYGVSKRRGEEAVLSLLPDSLVVRTAWLYGSGGKPDFVDWVRAQDAVLGAKTLDVVDDQTGCPTWAEDLAAALVDLASGADSGIVHVVNGGRATWKQFAEEVLRCTGSARSVRGIPGATLRRAAPRPADSTLRTDRLISIGRALRPWPEALADYLSGGGKVSRR